MKVIILKRFDAILKDIKISRKTTESISVKSRGKSIKIHPLIIKLLNTKKPVLKKDYSFDEVFNIFDEIDINCNNLNEYKLRSTNMIKRKNEMLECLRIMEDKLIDMFSVSNIARKIDNVNYMIN